MSSSSFIKIVRRLRLNVIDHKGLSNRVINGFCKAACSPNFKGVFAIDRLPKNIANFSKFIVIINLGRRDGGLISGQLPVGHFITIIATPKLLHFIDPFGSPPIGPEINLFLQLCGRKIKVNHKQIQPYTSNYCGLYCILFSCYADGVGGRMKLQFYNDNKEENDKLCVLYIKKMFQ